MPDVSGIQLRKRLKYLDPGYVREDEGLKPVLYYQLRHSHLRRDDIISEHANQMVIERRISHLS